MVVVVPIGVQSRKAEAPGTSGGKAVRFETELLVELEFMAKLTDDQAQLPRFNLNLVH